MNRSDAESADEAKADFSSGEERGDGHRVGSRSAPAARSGADAARPPGRVDDNDQHPRAEPGRSGPQKPRGPALKQPRSRVSREEEADDSSASSRSRDLRPTNSTNAVFRSSLAAIFTTGENKWTFPTS